MAGTFLEASLRGSLKREKTSGIQDARASFHLSSISPFQCTALVADCPGPSLSRDAVVTLEHLVRRMRLASLCVILRAYPLHPLHPDPTWPRPLANLMMRGMFPPLLCATFAIGRRQLFVSTITCSLCRAKRRDATPLCIISVRVRGSDGRATMTR